MPFAINGDTATAATPLRSTPPSSGTLSNGRRAYSLKEWSRLVLPELLNVAMTVWMVYIGTTLHLPAMIIGASINSAIQAIVIGHCWSLSNGKLSTVTSIAVSFFSHLSTGFIGIGLMADLPRSVALVAGCLTFSAPYLLYHEATPSVD